MLKRLDFTDMDLARFLSTGEGFASWHLKVCFYLGEGARFTIPEIRVEQSNTGRLELKDKSVVPFIASKINLNASVVGTMLATDIKALEPCAAGLFANEFVTPEYLPLKQKPMQFCMSCFTNALLQKEIPIFDPYWQSPWATHCIEHNTPLLPSVLLDGNEYQSIGFLYDDGSQYRNWCNRLEGARRRLNRNYSTQHIHMGGVSKSVIAMNKLFNRSEIAVEGAFELGLTNAPEVIRHKIYTAFYILSRRNRSWSLGKELTRDYVRKDGCFPTFDYFSTQILDVLDQEQTSLCIEYLAQFISAPETNFPYLLSENMKKARADFSKRIDGDCPEIQTDPIVYLCWLAWENFQTGFEDKISELFPSFSKIWNKNFAKIEAHLQR